MAVLGEKPMAIDTQAPVTRERLFATSAAAYGGHGVVLAYDDAGSGHPPLVLTVVSARSGDVALRGDARAGLRKSLAPGVDLAGLRVVDLVRARAWRGM